MSKRPLPFRREPAAANLSSRRSLHPSAAGQATASRGETDGSRGIAIPGEDPPNPMPSNVGGPSGEVRRWPLAVLALVLAVGGGLGLKRWLDRHGRHLARAEQLLDEGSPAAALDWLAVPAARNSTRERAALLQARASLQLGRAAQAVAPLESIDPHGPHAAEAAFWKGRTLFEVRQVRRAVEWFRASLSRRPDDVETLKWLAASLYELGDQSSAIDALRRATQLQNDDPRAWRTLALLSKDQGEHEEAWICYQRSLLLDPAQPQVRFELAETLVALGRYEEAEAQLEACRGGVPEADRIALLCHCARIRGSLQAYRSLLDESLQRHPDHPGLLAFRAQLDLAEGDPARAVERLSRVISTNPYHAQAIYQRGIALRRLGDAEAAARDLTRAAELNQLLEQMDRLNREAARSHDDPEVRTRLGDVCAALGKAELASSWYLAALACDPSHWRARLGLRALGREDLIRSPARSRRLLDGEAGWRPHGA